MQIYYNSKYLHIGEPNKRNIFNQPSEPPGWKTKCLVSTAGAEIVEPEGSRDLACNYRLSRANIGPAHRRGDRP